MTNDNIYNSSKHLNKNNSRKRFRDKLKLTFFTHSDTYCFGYQIVTVGKITYLFYDLYIHIKIYIYIYLTDVSAASVTMACIRTSFYIGKLSLNNNFVVWWCVFFIWHQDVMFIYPRFHCIILAVIRIGMGLEGSGRLLYYK